MSKNKLYGHKKWYEYKKNSGDKHTVEKRIERKIVGKVFELTLMDNGEKKKVKDQDFILKLNQYKSGTIQNNKFHAGNILFKLKGCKYKERSPKYYNDLKKGDKVLRKITIEKQTNKLAKCQKCTRNKLEAYLNDDPKLLEGSNFEYPNYSNHKIKIYRDDDSFASEKDLGILVGELSQEELKNKIKLYDQFRNINAYLYSIINDVILNSNQTMRNRFYEDQTRIKIEGSNKIKSILEELEKVKTMLKDNEALERFYKFTLGTKTESNNKLLFVKKLELYFDENVRIDKSDISTFLLGELVHYNIVKRVENEWNLNQDNNRGFPNKQSLQKTYIQNNKHNTYDSTDNTVYKKLIEKIENDQFEDEFNSIYEKFQVKSLAEKVQVGYISNSFKEDTFPYKILKDHYKKVIVNQIDFDNHVEEDQKIIYKQIYKYLKGRVNKCVNHKKFMDFGTSEERYKIVRDKTLRSLKQHILERIIYIGKRKHLNLETTQDFVESHAKEELYLELLAFFGTTNMYLNRYLVAKEEGKDDYKDFFGDNGGYNLDNTKLHFNNSIAEKLGFGDKDTFNKFIKGAHALRSYIIHANHTKLHNFMEKNDLESYYNNIQDVINKLKVKDAHICKALNTHIVFKGKEDLIVKLNELEYSTSELSKYLPSFSKIVSQVKLEYESAGNANSDKVDSIILNGLYYYLRIMYEKSISNSESDYLKYCEIQMDNNNKKQDKNQKSIDNHDEVTINKRIENMYRFAQKRASKGDKKAIKKFQNKFIQWFIEYLKDEHYGYSNIFDFSTFNKNLEELKQEIKKGTFDNKYEIKTVRNNITINNDFEYIISVCALLSDSSSVNKIRNRLQSTQVWLKLDEEKKGNTANTAIKDYTDIIRVLDEILNINRDKEMLLGMIEYDDIGSDIDNIINYICDKQSISEEKKEALIELREYLDFEDCKFKLNNSAIPNNKKKYIGKVRSVIDKSPFISSLAASLEYFKAISEQENMKDFKDPKFNGIYFNIDKTKKDNHDLIFKKKLYKNMTNPNFENLYNIFIKGRIKNLSSEDIEMIKHSKDLKEKVNHTHEILRNLNQNTKGFSKAYKDTLKNKILKTTDEDKRNAIFNSVVKYKDKANNPVSVNFQDFQDDFKKMEDYNEVKRIVESDVLNEVQEYLVNLNWKLLIHIYRFERDLHYIIKGLMGIGIFEELEVTDLKSKAYISLSEKSLAEICLNPEKIPCHYKFNEEQYLMLTKICKNFGIDLSKNGDFGKVKQDSIRNYIAHFYLVRSPFDKRNIIETINEVNELLSYRSKYNQAVYYSCFEVFKRNVSIDYDKIKVLSELTSDNLGNIILPKKVSMLELESKKMSYELVKKLFTVKGI